MDLQRRRLFANLRVHPQRALSRLAAAAGAVVGLAVPAAGQIAVEVSPLRVELTAAPGSRHTEAVTLTNQSDKPVRVRARVTDWYLSRDGTPQFQAAPAAWTAASAWVRLAPPEQVIDPGRQGVVRFTTAVPDSIADGGYRAAILFEFSPPGGDVAARGRDVVFQTRVATVVYVNVGQPEVAVELTNLVTRTPPGRPVEVVATLKNTSRANVRTKGTLTIYDRAGTVVRQVDVPHVPVLPESEREIAIPASREGDPPLAPGEYRVELKIDVGMRALLVGETILTVAR